MPDDAMSREGRQDLYRLAALLSDLQRILNPLPRGGMGDFQVEMVPPPPLPPTGIPGLAAGQPAGRAPARTAAEWASLAPGRPPPRVPSPLPPWIEPPLVPLPPVAEPEAAAPDGPEQETREGTGGSAAARVAGAVTSTSFSPVPAAPPPPSRGEPASSPMPPDDKAASAASGPAPMAPPSVRSAMPAETAAEPERRIETAPRIAGVRTAPAAPGTVREIASAAPSPAVARPVHPAAPALRESGAPPTGVAAAGNGSGDRLPAPVRLPREPMPTMSPAVRVPPPELSVARWAGTPAPGNRSEQPAPSPRAWAYPTPAAGGPITIEVPRLDAPIAEVPADISPGEPSSAETVDVEIEETVMPPLSETPGTRLLVRRGRILGNVSRDLRNAARDRFGRRFVPRFALRLP